MTAPTTFACPGCGAATAGGTARCERCGIRLVGELAMQLWQLDHQLAALRASREMLVARLRRDDSGDVLPAYAVRSAPGSETRRTLLVLGAVCLIAALTAGTALIWPALGVGGQTAVMVAMTAALLVGAVRLQHRLPATAEAVAAVGVAATAVDVVAGRRLVAPGLAGDTAHVYWVLGSVLALVALGLAGSSARRLHSLAVGAVGAAFATVAAVIEPTTVESLAVAGLVGTVVGLAVVCFSSSLPLSRAAVVSSAGVGAAMSAVVCAASAFVAAPDRGVALLCGLVVSVVVAAVPHLLPYDADDAARHVTACAGGLVMTALLLRADLVPLGDQALLTAGVAAAVLFAVAGAAASPRRMSGATFVGVGAALAEVAAQVALQLQAADADALGRAAAGLGVATVVLVMGAVLWAPQRLLVAMLAAGAATTTALVAVAEAAGIEGVLTAADSTAVVAAGGFALAAATAALLTRRAAMLALAVAVPAGVAAAVATDIALALRHVTTVEAYVVAPATVAFAGAVIAMWRMPALSSWALGPALAVSLLPTLLLALGGDVTRQVVVLVIGAALVAIAAQLRLSCPMVMGSAAVAALVLRVLGPQIAELPRWLTLGVLGGALLVLGSTWERRLQEMRRVAERARPTVAALR